MIESHVVSFELSQRLNFLGVNKKGIFLWIDHFSLKTGKHKSVISLNHGYERTIEMSIYNAYTASEILGMLPITIMSVDYEPNDEDADYGKLILEKEYDGHYECGYYLTETGEDVLFSPYRFTKDKYPQNALAKMLIYLIENNLVDVSEINGDKNYG